MRREDDWINIELEDLDPPTPPHRPATPGPGNNPSAWTPGPSDQPWYGIGQGLAGCAGMVMFILGFWGIGFAAPLVVGACVCGTVILSLGNRTGSGVVVMAMAFALPALGFGLHLFFWWAAIALSHH
ncbi:MAG: hypothetical protein KKI08_17230 [Armatimonadetes bacterium]|nr:hypothetical protein [Armatimonadota bacterium]